jgi:hypothetical protein
MYRTLLPLSLALNLVGRIELPASKSTYHLPDTMADPDRHDDTCF